MLFIFFPREQHWCLLRRATPATAEASDVLTCAGVSWPLPPTCQVCGGSTPLTCGGGSAPSPVQVPRPLPLTSAGVPWPPHLSGVLRLLPLTCAGAPAPSCAGVPRLLPPHLCRCGSCLTCAGVLT